MRALICAAVNLDGELLEPDSLVGIVKAVQLPYLGHYQVWRHGPCGLAVVSEQPFMDSRLVVGAEAALVLNGSIDNAVELARALSRDDLARSGSDAEILLHAYQAWGVECTGRLIGEFAFLLWDRRLQRLVASRDALGACELFYRTSQTVLVLSSQARSILDSHTPSPGELDEEYLADFLANYCNSGPKTPFRSVQRVLSGHQLVVENARIQDRVYWDLEPSSRDRPGSAATMLDEFRHHFTQAVHSCISRSPRTWCELSGGLDSSSIVAVAQKLAESDTSLVRRIATITLTFPRNPESDETAWADEALHGCPFERHFISCDDAFFDGTLEAAAFRNEPHFGILCFPFHRKQVEALRESSVKVMLSGSRAESVVLDVLPSPIYLAEMLQRGRLRDFVRELSRWHTDGVESLPNLLLWGVLRPILFPRLRRLHTEQSVGIQPWISKKFARRTGLSGRAATTNVDSAIGPAIDRYQYELVKRSEQMMHRGYVEWSVETRHPFLYRPLVELAMKVPWEIKSGPRQHKTILRESLRGILNEKIRTRRNWTSPTPAAFRAFARRWPEFERLGRTSLLVEMGIFESKAWREALQLARQGHAETFAGLTSGLALEYWLRSVLLDEGGHSSRRPAPALSEASFESRA